MDFINTWFYLIIVFVALFGSLFLLGLVFLLNGKSINSLSKPAEYPRKLISGPPWIAQTIGGLLIAAALIPFVFADQQGIVVSFWIMVSLSVLWLLYIVLFWIHWFLNKSIQLKPLPILIITGTSLLLLALFIAVFVLLN